MTLALPLPVPAARLALRPLTISAALAFNAEVHRRLPDLDGARRALGVERGGAVVGVAIVGHPNARVLDDGRRLQVLRCAVLEGDRSETGHRGACSMLYGACARAARAMGASDLWTYIHDDEGGVSLRAAGWIEDGHTRGGQWSRPSRERKEAPEPGRKRRWFAPWSAMLTRGASPLRSHQ